MNNYDYTITNEITITENVWDETGEIWYKLLVNGINVFTSDNINDVYMEFMKYMAKLI